MGMKSRLKEMRRTQRSDLKSIAEFRCYFVATPNGSPATRVLNRNGRQVMVTWAFSTFSEAETNAKGLSEEYGLELTVQPMSVGAFLGNLYHHLFQADIDILVTDGGLELPLTTFGVNNVGGSWSNLLEEARKDDSANPLLIEVARNMLKLVGGEESNLAVQGAPADELVRTLMGKRAVFPTVDLGIVWILSAEKDGRAEPVFIKAEGQEEFPLIIGPLAFSGRDTASNWTRVLAPDFAAQLREMTLRLDGFRAHEFLQMGSGRFASFARMVGLEEGLEPDVFLLDGGMLPLSVFGARFTESRIEYPEGHKPTQTWETVALTKGDEHLRRISIRAAAHALGVQVVEVPAEETQDAVPTE